MSNVTDLLSAQATEIDELHKLIRNYGKDGPDRKTPRYLNDKIDTFDELFKIISKNHEEIMKSVNTNQPYVKEKTYDTIKAKYEATRKDIMERIQANSPPTAPLSIATIMQTVMPPSINNMVNPGTSTASKDAPTSNISTEKQDENVNQIQPSSENERPQNLGDEQSNENLANHSNKSDDSSTTQTVDLLKIIYDDMLDLLATARDINETSSTGTIRVNLELINNMWSELRKLVYEYKSTGKPIAFNYNTLLLKYMNVTSKLSDFLQPISNSRVENNSMPTSSTQFSLPKIELPKFNGNKNEWQNFIALFDKIIHNNQKLDKGMKVEYLKTCIKDAAAKIINHLAPTPENYDTCYALLRKRFDNKRELVNCMLDNVISFPKIKNENADSLKTMHDTVYESLMSIKNLGVTNEHLFGHLISHILIKKLDSTTLVHYECQLDDVKELSNIDSFLCYLEGRFMALQAVGAKNTLNIEKHFEKHFEKHEKSSYHNKNKCIMCNGEHGLYKCALFAKKSVRERSDFVKEKKLCLNCFSSTHQSRDCVSKFSCKTCKKSHHSLLHFESKKSDEKSIVKANTAKVQHAKQSTDSNETIYVQSTIALQRACAVLLATAMIAIPDKNGSLILLRALLDQGSQSAFITESAAQTLRLPRKNINAVVSGIGAAQQTAKHAMQLSIFPRFESDFAINTEAIVLKKLTHITHFDYNEDDFEFINNLTLADPSFLRESEIDIILGAYEYAQAIKSGLIKSDKSLIAQNTEFGWIVSGAMAQSLAQMQVTSLVSNFELEQQMSRFFASDDFNNVDGEALTEEEEMCESHFVATHKRDEDGRYVVMLPFKGGLEKPDLGDSRRAALASLFSFERRCTSNPELKIQYCDFMNEYIISGHMREVVHYHPDAHYLPHHCVFKDSTTTKLRVVFNASQKTANKKSLNDQFPIGAIDQNDLTTIILRWRRHKIAFTADVEKMYRQIRVDESQTHLQRILWRESPDQPIKEFELSTVTYGTAVAPFLATRTLKQLSIDGSNEFPIASPVLREDCYMDDVLSGADSVEEAAMLSEQLTDLMKSGQFRLRKWSSNSHELLNHIPKEEREINSINGITKTLGICWSTDSDELAINVSLDLDAVPRTKRQLTSEIASLYVGLYLPSGDHGQTNLAKNMASRKQNRVGR
ncbi:uncharacterized protein LOC129572612 [Sitodiplosis mosellana]|uniref:uncharacterized protein LOC129572612 n=1 Tax=Sitodiplosis mosellana TaxID=263140 RepID=UPI00244422A4|nr:uncharacterized protein LOC129572612 [Sitodiplosis mosellana]